MLPALLLIAATATAADTLAAAAQAVRDSAPAGQATRFAVRDSLRPASDGRGRLREPRGVACDAFGRVTVTDATLRTAQRWDAAGDWLDEAGALGSDADQFRRPTAVARAGAAGMAVLDEENRRVLAFDLHGRQRGVLVDLADPVLEARTGRIAPVALAADAGGTLYVADGDRDRLLVFDFDGLFVRELGGFGPRPGSFRQLAAVATGPHGVIVTAERPQRASRRERTPGEVRLQWLDPGGLPLAQAMLPLSGRRAGEEVLALAVDDSGRVALADAAGGWVHVTDHRGTLLASRGDLAGPAAVAFAPGGGLWVAEADAARVRRFEIVPVAGR